VVDARYDFGRHSAVGFAATVNRNSELFYNGASASSQFGFLEHVQTNNLEMIGTYIFRLPSNERVKPYAMFGGGMVRFSPNNDFNTGAVPSTTTKAAFAYGFGTDLTLTGHWAIRLQYRGLVRPAPDFKLSSTNVNETFGTSLRSHVPEPSIQLVYHFGDQGVH
jgi:opacity protein-like surface antigen